METRILLTSAATSSSTNYEGMMANRKESAPVHHIHHHQRVAAAATLAVGHHNHQQQHHQPQQQQQQQHGGQNHHGHHHSHHHQQQQQQQATSQQHQGGVPATAMRPHSTPATLLWLEENYEMAQGVCVPRNTLYLHYVDFCSKHGMTPVNAASFGKIIRQQFPQLTTRRLGTRGQSRYHYYGIAIRENSPYYELVYSKKGLQASEDMRKDHLRQMPASCGGQGVGPGSAGGAASAAVTSSRSSVVAGGLTASSASSASSSAAAATAAAAALATRLPEFPNLRDLCLPPGGISGGVPEERVATFIVMYRAHCQRLLDTVIRGSFQEVQTFLLHYWQGMPPHLIGVLGSHVVVNIVGVCDSILYRSVCSILMSSVIRGVPDNLIQMIRKFASELDSWLRAALEDLPENLRAVKIDLARHFCHMLRRQSSLNQLFGTVRLALHDPQVNSVLLHDWRRQDVHVLAKSALQAAAHFNSATGDGQYRKRRSEFQPNPSTVEFIVSLCGEFERLLAEQAPLEAYTEWVESIVDRCVLQQQQQRHQRNRPASTLRHSIRQFLLVWMAFSGRLLRDLTAQSAAGFETFHLIRVMIDDYFLYLVELLHVDDRARELMRNITLDVPPEYLDTDYEGFLATVFANFDVSPEMSGGGMEHSSPGSANEPHYTTDAVTGDEPGHMESTSPGQQQQQQVIVNNATDYGGMPAVGTETTPPGGQEESCATFAGYDYANNVRLGNGYKFNGAAGNYASYPSNATPPAAPHQIAYYQTTGFADIPPTTEQYNGSYNTTTYQSYVRRDFTTDVQHCGAGFYPSDHQSPLVVTANTGTTYATIPSGNGDYYGSYDVTSSASSNSSTSVYGELSDQTHAKLKKNDSVITQQTPSMAPNHQESECVAKAPETGAATNFHIASESYVRS